MRHPWLVKAMGRFDPARHPRGQPENAGEFASTGASAKPAGKPDLRPNPDLDEAFGAGPTNRPKPGAPLRPASPDLDAAMGMGAPPAKPAARPAAPDAFADYVPGTQDVRQFPRGAGKPAAPAAPQRPGLNTLPALPHERTQRQALHAAQAVKPGDAKSHAAAVQALDAHLKAGLAELHRRAAHAGPRAGNLYRKAAAAFRAKMSAARAKVDQLAGRSPPRVPGPPPLNQRGKVPPWVPLGHPSRPQAQPHPAGPTPMPARGAGARGTPPAAPGRPSRGAPPELHQLVQNVAGNFGGKHANPGDVGGEIESRLRRYSPEVQQAFRRKFGIGEGDDLETAGRKFLARNRGNYSRDPELRKPKRKRKSLHPWLVTKAAPEPDSAPALALDLAVPHPWLVKSRDATGHEHAADGRFGAGGGKKAVDPDGKARSLLKHVAKVPAAVRLKVTAFVKARYAKLSARYGRNGARAILGATILLLPAPVPGSSLIPVAFAEVALRLRRAVMKGGPLDAKTIQAEARALLADLMEHMKGTDQ